MRDRPDRGGGFLRGFAGVYQRMPKQETRQALTRFSGSQASRARRLADSNHRLSPENAFAAVIRSESSCVTVKPLRQTTDTRGAISMPHHSPAPDHPALLDRAHLGVADLAVDQVGDHRQRQRVAAVARLDTALLCDLL